MKKDVRHGSREASQVAARRVDEELDIRASLKDQRRTLTDLVS
jgi:hypothetical protein